MSLFGKSQRDAEAPIRPVAREAGFPPPTEGAREQRSRGSRPERGGESVAHIGKSITIKGDLSGNEDLEVEGQVEGRIDLPSNQLTIGAEGKVKADVHAKTVIVVGHVTGNVSATERVEVQASGIVDGDVRAPRLVVQEGAVLNGSVEMGESVGKGTAKPAPAPPKVAAGGGEAG